MARDGDNYSNLASKESIDKTIESLKKNGVEVFFVETGDEAQKKVMEVIPEGAEVMTMTSVTLDTTGIQGIINDSGKYDSVRKKLMSMDGATQKLEMNRLGAAPAYALGSVHAVTEQGQIMIASNTGSQLPAYAYGAGKVVWVVGAQKIVKNHNDGLKRIYEHCLPLESERAKKAYGVPGSAINKILVIEKEVQEGRLTMILVNQVLGF